jgi:serine/threonine protein kinase/tetratricopeptide (TPR) repeat protein
LLRHLGRGAYGEVWHAEAPGGVEVAVKIIPRKLNSDEPETELQALHLIKGLRHQNLLSLQAFFPLPDRLVIVLELADSCLRRRMRACRDAGQEGIPPAELLVYVRETAEAIDFLHSRELLHRDIKPDNLLLLGSHVKVADYGLARVMDRSSLQTATTVGTPSYMAPEVFQGKVSPHSDQYSLAVTYAELRLGRPPLVAENLGQIMFQHLYAEPDLGGLAPAERQVLLRALAKDPAKRFPSCTALGLALLQALPEPTLKGVVASATPAAPPIAGSGGPISTDLQTPAPNTLLPRESLVHTLVNRSPATPRLEKPENLRPGNRRWLWPTLILGQACIIALILWATGVFPKADNGASDARAALVDKTHSAPESVVAVPKSAVENPKEDRHRKDPPSAAASHVPAPQPKPKPPAPVPALLRIQPIQGIVLNTGQSATLEVRVQRQNCSGPVRLQLDDLPAGVEAEPVVLDDGVEKARIKLQARENAVEGVATARLRAELGAVRGEQTTRVEVHELPRLRLTVSPATIMTPGQIRYFGIQFDRRKVSGPIVLDVSDLPRGIKVNGLRPMRIPAGRDRACLVLSVATDAAPGLRELSVQATSGAVRAGGVLNLTVAPLQTPAEQLAEENAAIRRSSRDPVAFLNRALAHRKAGESAKAIADYDEALLLDPNFARAYQSRGNTYRQLNQYDKALADLTEAIRLDPDGYPSAYVDRATAYRVKGDNDRAIADYSEAIRLDRQLATAYLGRGMAYENRGEHDRALADLNEVIRLEPRNSVAFGQRGHIQAARKEVEAAIASFDQAIRLNPQYAWALNYRGTLHNQKGDQDKALADFEQAILVSPRYALPYRNRGNYYRLHKDYERAIADFTEAIRLNPKYANAYQLRGLAYRAKGDTPHAEEDFQKARQLESSGAAPARWLSLFNGKDLTGWKFTQNQEHGWNVENGLLTGRAKQGKTHLFTRRGDFTNFHLRTEVAVNDNGNSGIFFRCPFGLPRSGVYPGGYEAQILHHHTADAFLTGSLHDLVKAPALNLAPDEFFRLEIAAEGREITVKINGRLTAHYVAPREPNARDGYLALQVMEPRTTVVRFRRIEIQQLPGK